VSNVSLTIGGRTYAVACAAGEESHVTELGRMIDRKLSAMGDMSGQSESRTLLFAALLLADDLFEAESKVSAAAAPPPPAPQIAPARLVRLAERLENLASRLEA